jgi:hypothetical protein
MFKLEVTSAREADDSSDNKKNDPWIDDGRGMWKKQGDWPSRQRLRVACLLKLLRA